MTPDSELEQMIERVESLLAALGAALRAPHAQAAEAAALQRALAGAVEQLRRSARTGQLSPQLRQRLVRARGLVTAQRESMARAGAALARAIDVLLPESAPRVAYTAEGISERRPHSGMLRA